MMHPNNKLDLSEETLDPYEPSAHERGRHHAHTETFKSCHCDDVTTSSRRPKGKSKVKYSSKRDEKNHDRDRTGDGNMDEDDDDDDDEI